MRREIALQLLNETMSDSGLGEDESHKHFLKLETLAEYKYNSYEMYRPGRLFLENLYVWLSQFSGKEKKVALEFALDQIVFVSRKEIHQLAGVLYDDIIRTILRESVAHSLKLHNYKVKKIVSSKEFADLHRSTLFLAMSDGARVDYFRRQNLEIVNEQIIPYYLASEPKLQKMNSDLAHDLSDPSAKFKFVFLLDDFCGSGRTFLREETEIDVKVTEDLPSIPPYLQATLQIDRQKGKLILKSDELPPESEQKLIQELSSSTEFQRLFEQVIAKKKRNDVEPKGSFAKLMSTPGLAAILDATAKVFYTPLLMTEYAFSRLTKVIARHQGIPSIKQLDIRPVCRVSDSIRISLNSHEISGICEAYYHLKMGDEHSGGVKYGYVGCGLPLVMHHNTPNNSIFLLWCGRENFEPLFVRYERHGREML